MPQSKSARLFIAVVVLAGFSVFGAALLRGKYDHWVGFISFLLVASIASRLRVKLPGVTGMMSVNLPFILVAAAEMTAAEAMSVACASTVIQCLPRTGKKFNPVQTLFNCACMVLAVGAARFLYHSATLQSLISSRTLLLGTAAAGYFLANSLPVAIIIGLTENRNALRAWGSMVKLSYLYYLTGAGIAGAALTASGRVGWQAPLILLPLMAAVFYCYRYYFAAVASSQSEAKSAEMAQGAS